MANRNISVRLQVEGGKFKADLIEAGQVGQAALNKIGEASQTASTSVQQVTKSVGALDAEAAKAARSAERLKRTYQDGYAATQEQAKASDLLKRGALTQAEYSAVVEGIGKRYAVANNNARLFGAALEAQTRQARITGQQFAQLQPQLNDIFTQLTTGTSPLTVALQQGPQITQIFGGIGATFRAIGPVALGVAAAFAAVGVPLGIILSRASDLESQSRGFNVALAAMGRQGQTTADDLGKLVDRLRDVGVARDEARGAVSALVRTPGLGTGQIERLAGVAPDLAAATGGTATEAAKQLADAATGGYDAIIKLDRALGGFLAPSQRQQIRLLTEQGEKTRAFQIALESLENRVRGLNDQALSPTEKKLNDIGRAWDRLVDNLARGAVGQITLSVVRSGIDALAGIVGPSSSSAPRSSEQIGRDALDVATERLARLNGETARYRSQDAEVTIPGFGFGSPNAIRAQLQAEIDALRARVADLSAGDREGARGRAFSGLPSPDVGGGPAPEQRIGAATETQIADLERRRRLYGASPSQRPIIEAEISAETEARERGLNALEKEALVRARVADATAQQRQAITDQTRETEIQTAQTLRVAEAYTRGQGAAQAADAARQAALESYRTGVDAAARAQEILRDRVAQATETQARAANDATIAADSARRYAEAELQGADAVRQVEVAERVANATREARAALTNATGEAERQLRAAIDATTKAIKDQAAAEDQRAITRARRQAQDDAQIARLEAEAAAITDPDKRRAAELAVERERRLQAQRQQFGRTDAQVTAAQDAAAQAREQARFISDVRSQAQSLASDISGFLVDGYANANNAGKSMFSNLAEGAVGLFRRAAARIAATLLEQKFILPITTQIVGAIPSAFGVASAGGGGGGFFDWLGSLFGSGGGLGASAGNGASLAGIGGDFIIPGTFARGAAFQNGRVTAFARGGIVDRPVLFPMANGAGLMGEAGPEAVMPLGRDSRGRLGVRAGGADSGIRVIVNNNGTVMAPQQTQVQERRGGDGVRELVVLIEDTVDGMVANGRLDPSMKKSYGVKRPVRRT